MNFSPSFKVFQQTPIVRRCVSWFWKTVTEDTDRIKQISSDKITTDSDDYALIFPQSHFFLSWGDNPKKKRAHQHGWCAGWSHQQIRVARSMPLGIRAKSEVQANQALNNMLNGRGKIKPSGITIPSRSLVRGNVPLKPRHWCHR